MGNSRQRAGKKLIVQGSILAIATIIVRLIGIVYRIPLTNIVGNEGMGYYGFAFEVYQFLVILSTNIKMHRLYFAVQLSLRLF